MKKVEAKVLVEIRDEAMTVEMDGNGMKIIACIATAVSTLVEGATRQRPGLNKDEMMTETIRIIEAAARAAMSEQVAENGQIASVDMSVLKKMMEGMNGDGAGGKSK